MVNTTQTIQVKPDVQSIEKDDTINSTTSYFIGKPAQNKLSNTKKIGKIFNSKYDTSSKLTTIDHVLQILSVQNHSDSLLFPQKDSLQKISIKKQLSGTQAKFEIEIRDYEEKIPILSIIFNQEYGVIVINHLTNQKNYMDLNIFNSQKKVDLYLAVHEEHLYLFVQGITFNDVIYKQSI